MFDFAPMLDSLAAYPRWFAVACVTVAIASGLYVFAKLLKWFLYLVIGLVIIVGGATTAWVLLK